MTQSFLKSRPGSLLLISLLALSAIMVGVGAISTVVLREAGLSRDLDNSTLALFAAEGSLEQGLYKAYIEGKGPSDIISSGTLNNGVAWQIQAEDETMALVVDRLQKDASLTVNLYNKSDPGNPAAGIGSLVLNSSYGDDFEIAISDWDGSALTNTRTITLANCVSPCAFNEPSDTLSHQVIIKALDNDILDLKITAWGPGGGPVVQKSIPLPLTIKGIGSIGDSKQAVTGTLRDTAPWL